ncbi:MAG: hypothetical protein SO442_07030 [Prevotella sp.]|nr:hypothetical protein [Prevotella sp.]
MSEPLRGCYVGSYNRKENVYHYSLRTATKGHALQWVYVSVIFARSLPARPAQGAATTVNMRCLSSVADARTSVPTVRGGLLHALHPHSPTLIFTSPYTQPWRRSTGTP